MNEVDLCKNQPPKYQIDQIEIDKSVGNPLKRITKFRPIKGFDTETEGEIKGRDKRKEGMAVVITDSDGFNLVSNISTDFLDFLHNKRNRKTLNFFYNLNFDVNAILKYFNDGFLHNLRMFGFIEIEGYRLKYLEDKVFTISKWSEKEQKYKNPVSYYDMAQFYEYLKLEKAAILYDVEHKTNLEEVGKIYYENLRKKPDYRKEVVDYCYNDSVVCKQLAELFANNLRRFGAINDFKSSASIGRMLFRTQTKEVLGMSGSKVMNQAALNSYHAGFNETAMMGTFKKHYEYDIVSAYPSVMMDLINPKSKPIIGNQHEYVPDAAYSFYKVKIDLDDETHISPVWKTWKGGIYHPIGNNIEIWVCKSEYEFLTKICDPVILEDKHILYSDSYRKDEDYIFRDYIIPLFNARTQAKKDGNLIVSLILKKLMNALYGSMYNVNKSYYPLMDRKNSHLPLTERELGLIEPYAELNGDLTPYIATLKVGAMFNPIIASTITANIRKTIFEVIYQNQKYIVSISTDGFISIKKLHNLKLSNNMGDYSVTISNNPLMVFGNSRKFKFGADGEIIDDKSRMRGSVAEPSILFDSFKANPFNTHHNVKQRGVVTIHQHLHHKKHIGALNTFYNQDRYFSLSIPNRLYPKEFFSYNDIHDSIIESEPIEVNNIVNHHKNYNMVQKIKCSTAKGI